MAHQEENRRHPFVILLIHTAAALAVMLLLLALFSLLVEGGVIPMSALMPLAVAAVLAGVWLGSFTAARRVGSRRLPVGLAVGLLNFAFLFVVGMMFAFPPAKHTFFILLAALGGGLAGGLLAAPRAGRRRASR